MNIHIFTIYTYTYTYARESETAHEDQFLTMWLLPSGVESSDRERGKVGWGVIKKITSQYWFFPAFGRVWLCGCVHPHIFFSTCVSEERVSKTHLINQKSRNHRETSKRASPSLHKFAHTDTIAYTEDVVTRKRGRRVTNYAFIFVSLPLSPSSSIYLFSFFFLRMGERS